MSSDKEPARPDDAELHERLSRLRQDLRVRDEARESQKAPQAQKPAGMGRAMSVGLNAFSEFVGAIVVGGFIGWQGDRLLGTSPGLLIAFLGLGVAAGFWNVYRVAAPKAPLAETSEEAPDGPAARDRGPGGEPSGKGDES